MKTQELANSCEVVMERAINGFDTDQEHVSGCQQCRRMLATISAIKSSAAPADFSAEFPRLKASVMKRLRPILKEKYSEEKAASFIHSWFFKLSMGTALMVLMISLSLQMFRAQKPETMPNNHALPIVLTENFTISINGQAPKSVSLDNPVALFANETAKITLPDNSILKVEGPARLTVAPRGFHLASGFLTASVSKGKGNFTGTTPHGQIEVLGTVFSCDSTAQKTVVKVIEGKVRVKPDKGAEKILIAGETVEMLAEVSTGSETIPSIDNE